jgi:hypothetical protein
MPNVLAHFGVGRLVTKLVVQDVHPLWIYTGSILPDVPWILQRLAAASQVDLDPYAVRLYSMSQASLISSLLLSAALAAIAYAPAKTFAVLSMNSLLHLLLDACETKWANGVHLFAPLSWRIYSAELFWPESMVTTALTACGLAIFVSDWVQCRGSRAPHAFHAFQVGACALTLLFLLAYFLVPLYCQEDLESTDSHFVAALRHAEDRSGQYIELDRNRFEADRQGGSVTTFAGEKIKVLGALPQTSGLVSIRGRFIDHTTIRVDACHEHWHGVRDWASMVGLLLLGLWWSQWICTSIVARRPSWLRAWWTVAKR